MVYWIGRTLFFLIFRVFYRLKVRGHRNIPKDGFIVASNHNSLADPPLVGASLPRGVYFMAKKELFDIPVFGNIIRLTHAFEVDRSMPRPSTMKKAISLLKSGKILLIFPEGTRKSSEKIRKGVALLAHKAGVPVVPSRIDNNSRLIRFPRLKYTVGRPLKFPVSSSEKAPPGQYDQFCAQIMKAIYSL